MRSYLTLLIANIKNRKKLQLIHAREGDTRVAFSRVFFTRARVSLALLSLRENGGLLVVYNFGKWKVRPTEMTRPVKVDHLQSWS